MQKNDAFFREKGKSPYRRDMIRLPAQVSSSGHFLFRMKVSIANPCSEKWDSFEKRGNTGFCLSCQKDVVDFTKYSDEEIIGYFKKHAFNKTCGRFKSSQLKTYTLPKKKRDFGAIAAMLTAGVLSVANPSESNAAPARYETVTSIDDEIGDNVTVQTSTMTIGKGLTKITGRVKDETGGAIPAVNVVIKGTSRGTTTDENGDFSIEYADEDEKITLVFSFIGYVTVEREVLMSQSQKDIGIVSLSPDLMALGDVCIIDPWYSPRRWWWGIRNVFSR